MASGVHALVFGNKISPLPQHSTQEEVVAGARYRLKPIAKPGTERRKNVPGCFGKHNRHRAERACRRVGKDLRALVAFRGRHGLRIASRERVAGILRRMEHGKAQMAKVAV
jgi:hypothetical protein